MVFYQSVNDVHSGMYKISFWSHSIAGHMILCGLTWMHLSSSWAYLITALNVVKAVICGAENGLMVHLDGATSMHFL